MQNLKWWWLSYSNDKGEFLHVVIQKASSGEDADRRALVAGLADRGTVAVAGEMPEEDGPPPLLFVGRRLNREEAAELARRWQRGGRLMTSDETKKVYVTGVVPRKAGD